MKKMKILFASLLFSLPLIAADVYDSIELLPFDPSGSFAAEGSLDQILQDHDVKTVIEVGSWAGASTRFFAHRVGEDGLVYAVDHWQGTPNQRGEQTDQRLSHIFHLFLSNIRQAGLTDRVIPIRMKSHEAALALEAMADLIYIDAARDRTSIYQSILDWSNHLNPNGILCGAEWREPEVRTGVKRAATKLGKEIQIDRKGYFWVFK